MATPKDKLNEIIKNFNDIDIAEIIDFAEFIKEKRKKAFDEAFNNVKEEDEPLSEEELNDLKDASSSESISYKEMWGE